MSGTTRILALFLSFCLLVSGCGTAENSSSGNRSFSWNDIPAFSGEAYVILNQNQPDFPQDDFTTNSFESYSPLDELGRCGVAYANIGIDLMPTEPRGNIGQIKPSGWQTVKYDSVDGKYLYNRCHLIGFQLTGENANRENLITGTRVLNVNGMLPFENLVADYIKETEHHVLYRVSPIFAEDHLVASGVQMEAQSVEDDEICFNVYVYNAQPGIAIDYATGESQMEKEGFTDTSAVPQEHYILNINSHKFHHPDCSGARNIGKDNRKDYVGMRQNLIDQGYLPCGICKP